MPNAMQAWRGCQLPDFLCLDKVIEGHFFFTNWPFFLSLFTRVTRFIHTWKLNCKLKNARYQTWKSHARLKDAKLFVTTQIKQYQDGIAKIASYLGGSEIFNSHCLLLQSAWCDSHQMFDTYAVILQLYLPQHYTHYELRGILGWKFLIHF